MIPDYVDVSAVKAELVEAFHCCYRAWLFRRRALARLELAIKKASAYVCHGRITDVDRQYLGAWLVIVEDFYRGARTK